MEKNTLITGVLMLILGVGIGYSIERSSLGRGGPHMMRDGSMMGQDIDQHFIAQMIPHHEGAIEMAKIALERSKRSEIISLANGIIEAQEREIADMKSWYQDWFDSTPPAGGMGMGGMMHMDGMSGDSDALSTVSDAQFDREFIDQMIPHHEMAVMMASMLAASTERDEMKVLADQIITSQSREIDMMRSWRASWYR
jgi:uncharacterized protein (DUF305 family)